ncbi:MAG: hypothetical protein AAGC55_16880, partial [Myxococcota bacterium]
ELARSAQNALARVATPAARVPTRASEVPSVDMSGDADPGQMNITFSASGQQTDRAASAASSEIHRDFGENDILPETPDAAPDMLQASKEARLASSGLGASGGQPADNKGAGAKGGTGGGVLPAGAMAAIDAEASPILHQRIGAERDQHSQGEAQYKTETQAAHHKARLDMAELEDSTQATQTEAQRGARNEVAAARLDWQGEIAEVQSDFRDKASQARGEHEQQIQAKELAGNREASEHIAEAERKAEVEKRKAENEAEDKKHEAKQESKGFWGWVKSRAKALVDGLKQAVNFIYDNLRKAVKALFEAAKKLALGAIELARAAIVGLIAAYGAVLKGFVSIALAAFPGIRDKIKQRIDQAVAKATEVVNKAAAALKSGVTAIVDFLANTIDKALGLIQDLYSGIFTVIGMLVSGELRELLARLGNLIDAAKTAPGQFETAAYEELLGGNLDQPLSPAELMAAGRRPPATGGQNAGPQARGEVATATGATSDTADSAGGTDLPGPPWTHDNVGVDQIATGEQLSPELTAQLMQMTGGDDGEVTFGESQDPGRSLEAMLGSPTQGQDQEQNHGENQTRTEGGLHSAGYDDGLTPRERAGIKWQAMKAGLSTWWSENWPLVLAGGVLGVAGFIAANILTGGAILAALPTLMTAVGYIFTGLMVAQLAGHLRDYLHKGWCGDIQGGGKSLAKGLAAGAIERDLLV